MVEESSTCRKNKCLSKLHFFFEAAHERQTNRIRIAEKIAQFNAIKRNIIIYLKLAIAFSTLFNCATKIALCLFFCGKINQTIKTYIKVQFQPTAQNTLHNDFLERKSISLNDGKRQAVIFSFSLKSLLHKEKAKTFLLKADRKNWDFKCKLQTFLCKENNYRKRPLCSTSRIWDFASVLFSIMC